MNVTLMGFNTYKGKDGVERAELHCVTDLKMKNGVQVMIVRCPIDPFVSLVVGKEYKIITEPYTFNGELRTRFIGVESI